MRIAMLRRSLIATIAALALPAAAIELPDRQVPRPQTTAGVPHIQLGVTPKQELSEALLARVEAFEGIEIHPTIVSMPGALGFWIEEDLPLARPDVIVRGREFAHIHPDGSLHATLSPALAAEAVDRGWAILQPWALRRPDWEGFVMIYTPLTEAETEVVFQLIVAGFDFVTKGEPGTKGAQTRPTFVSPQSTPPDPSKTCSTC